MERISTTPRYKPQITINASRAASTSSPACGAAVSLSGFDKFLQEVNVRNEYQFAGVTIMEHDKLLTRSGCLEKCDTEKTCNHPFVVMAKLVQAGFADTQAAVARNPSPKHPS